MYGVPSSPFCKCSSISTTLLKLKFHANLNIWEINSVDYRFDDIEEVVEVAGEERGGRTGEADLLSQLEMITALSEKIVIQLER